MQIHQQVMEHSLHQEETHVLEVTVLETKMDKGILTPAVGVDILNRQE